MNYATTILDLIGNTPLVKLGVMNQRDDVTILLKMESFNPGGSVKDRIGVSMIEAAERDGLLKPGGIIIEPTSGNTGIGLALVARLKGYRCLFVMTDKASHERVRYLKALGADVTIVSSAAKPNSPEYYWNTAKRLSEEIPNAIMLNQYDNPANPDIHERTTGPEIWNDTSGSITHFISGVGTGGTITGNARFLKSKNPDIKVIGADPTGSSIKTFKDTGRLVESLPYLVEGVGQERIPGNLDLTLVDEIMNISDRESFEHARRLAREEGIFCGGSSGMNVACALKVAESAPAGSVIVVIICDTGERYLSKHHSDEWLKEKHFLDANRIVLKTVLQTKSSAKQLPPLVSLSSSDRLDEALKIMKAFELSEIPIIDNGQLVGIIRENRVMSSVIDDPVNKENSITTVIEPTPPTLDCNEDIERAVVELKRFALIIVTEFGAPVGVISRHDIIEYI